MSKLTVLFLTLLVVFSVRCFAESLDDVEPRMDRKDDIEEMGLDDEIERRSAHAQAKAAAGFQNQPVPYQRQAVNCYACVDCPQIQANVTTKTCPSTNDRMKYNKCVVYTEKYRHMKKPWYVRGCASERGSCEEIRKAHEQHEHIVKLVSCTECEGDRCNVNGVSRSIPNLLTSFVVLVLTPLIGKHTLS